MPVRSLPSFISRRVIRGRYVFLNLNPIATKDLAVTCSRWEECSPVYEIKRDSFRYLTIEFIAGGTWELSTRHGKWTMGPGTIFAYARKPPILDCWSRSGTPPATVWRPFV